MVQWLERLHGKKGLKNSNLGPGVHFLLKYCIKHFIVEYKNYPTFVNRDKAVSFKVFSTHVQRTLRIENFESKYFIKLIFSFM